MSFGLSLCFVICFHLASFPSSDFLEWDVECIMQYSVAGNELPLGFPNKKWKGATSVHGRSIDSSIVARLSCGAFTLDHIVVDQRWRPDQSDLFYLNLKNGRMKSAQPFLCSI